MIAVHIAVALTIGVLVCHYFNGDEWDYFFGVMFFAGLPFGVLMEEGLAIALWGYSFGLAMLILMTVFAYALEYNLTGNWESAV